MPASSANDSLALATPTAAGADLALVAGTGAVARRMGGGRAGGRILDGTLAVGRANVKNLRILTCYEVNHSTMSMNRGDQLRVRKVFGD